MESSNSCNRIVSRFTLALPQWIDEQAESWPSHISSLDQRMEFVLELCRANIKHGSGGPFAASVFEKDSGKLISVGVNRTVPESCSIAHAEILAVALAQRRLGTFDLAAPGQAKHQLVVNAQPCAMCCGAIPWSGVKEVVFAVSKEEVEQATGFDEGFLDPKWRGELALRGISLVEGVKRAEALALLQEYVRNGGPVYNSSSQT